jgi:hypothetical protein
MNWLGIVLGALPALIREVAALFRSSKKEDCDKDKKRAKPNGKAPKSVQ